MNVETQKSKTYFLFELKNKNKFKIVWFEE